jgi:hypothetical protein
METPKIIIELDEYNRLKRWKEELEKIESSDSIESILCRRSGFCGIEYPLLKGLNTSEANTLLHKEIASLNKYIAELEGQLRKLATKKSNLPNLPNWFRL